MKTLIIVVALAVSAFAQGTGGQQWDVGPPGGIESGTTYRDMGILDNVRLGIAPIVRPGDLRNVTIGYRHAITDDNRDVVCDRFRRGQVLIGVAAREEIWVPHRASERDCRRTEQDGFNVFISPDGDNADRVISWQTHNNLRETWQSNPLATD